jgi:endogenous inhibitor of DNA gyrase (YacG/DUF329 family)
MRCPTCKKVFEESGSLTIPFCSVRCRQVDTNRWLSEEQRVPAGGLDEESPQESPDLLAEEEGQASHLEENSGGE